MDVATEINQNSVDTTEFLLNSFAAIELNVYSVIETELVGDSDVLTTKSVAATEILNNIFEELNQ